MIEFYYAFLILLLGFLSGVIGSITYLKGIRGEGKSYPHYELILSGILFGSLGVLLVLFLSKEIKDEDRLHNHSVLFSNLAMLLIQVGILFLLSYFKVIVF